MYKKSHLLVCLTFVIALAGTVHAAPLAPNDASVAENLCLWLRNPELDYDSDAGIWADFSGKGNDAQASVEGFTGPAPSSGENPAVFSRPFSAVHCDPATQELLKATNLNDGQGLTHLTIFSVQKIVAGAANADQRAVGFGSYQDGGRADHFNMSFDVTVRKDNGRIEGKNQDLPLDEFVIYVARMDPSVINMWINSTGTLSLAYTATASSYTTSNDQFYVGDLRYTPAGDFDVAEIIVFNTALTDTQVEGISEWLQANVGSGGGHPLASRPSPKDGSLHENTWANLVWSAGYYAVSHDLYFGSIFDDVNDGAEGTFVGNLAVTTQVVGFPGFPAAEGLQPGTTYYWRVDEVNDANAASPWKGDVWSFAVPPRTAYFPAPADGGESVALDAKLTWTPGFEAKLHAVYFGDNFEDVNNAAGGPLSGDATFTPPGPLELAKIYYWRVDESDPPNTYKGAVWSFRTEGTAADPIPAKGAVDVSPTPILEWTAADLAGSHEIYLGTDADAVANAGKNSPEYKASQSVGEETFAADRLELMTTYYWRVDEVNSAEPGSPWIGNVWSFTTGDFLVVDDFEAYNDIDPPDEASNRIFDKWIDGYGTLDNGALVGNPLPPYAEQTIVHGGDQSMNYAYDNAGKTSEATLTLTDQRDWTAEGVTKLSIWIRGSAANAADRIYVALNGTALLYHDDTAATQLSGWKEWIIDLATFGVNLTNVDSISIGIGTRNAPSPSGGTGTMYFDDIRLVR
ncbi:MAG: hypothetical protein AMJ65_08900 [Phycisphaerae bacterium SG8_4]|nr:MAG: hypothetical protein AMJ65_08900 [Phycisphaerae bacterium SG8_4]